MNPSTVTPWGSDWVWSIPLIVVTVVFHAYALGQLNQAVSFVLKSNRKTRLPNIVSVFIVGGTALCATVLQGVEASIWAIAYCLLGALPDRKSAMLYSLGAMTTYGNGHLSLESRWQLMGSLEALNGWILFGLTTAFLFTVIQEVWANRKLPI
ncbi:MAG: hypothetical protein WA419_22510 [Silvibacterium sp.]